MSVLVGRDTRVLCQGITGANGSFHTEQALAYGTKVVAGVTPGKGGTKAVGGVPVFDTVERAVAETGAEVSVVYVPAPAAPDAILETARAGLRLVVCITEGIPALDMARVLAYLRGTETRLVGPNGPGVITPGECKIGIMPGYIHRRGRVGVVSRSGTLTYEAVWQLTTRGIGQSTCFGIGGDPIVGTDFVEALRLFGEDPGTDAVVLIGEIGGTMEEEAGAYLRDGYEKPVVAFVAGRSAPPGKRMGHAGAIIAGGSGRAEDKVAALRESGVSVVDNPSKIGESVASVLAERGLSGRRL